MRGRSTRGAPGCVGSHVRALGSVLCVCEAYGCPLVEAVRGATEGESIVMGSSPKISQNLTT